MANPVQELYNKIVHSAYLVELPNGELKTIVELEEIYKEMLEVKSYLNQYDKRLDVPRTNGNRELPFSNF